MLHRHASTEANRSWAANAWPREDELAGEARAAGV